MEQKPIWTFKQSEKSGYLGFLMHNVKD
uniref:Uncharacterized protein n=1 Tax=Arundo donax TaxID=35708 RepID=A0A0A9B9D6_ARUDO